MFELIRKFLKTIGDKYKGQIVIDPRRWINKELAIKIKHDEWNGETKEKVHYPLTIDKAMEISAKQKSNAINESSTMAKSECSEPEITKPDDKIPFLS